MKIKKWLKGRKEKRNQLSFETGFSWIMTNFFLYGTDINLLLEVLEMGKEDRKRGKASDNEIWFDEGAEAGIDVLKKYFLQ